MRGSFDHTEAPLCAYYKLSSSSWQMLCEKERGEIVSQIAAFSSADQENWKSLSLFRLDVEQLLEPVFLTKWTT